MSPPSNSNSCSVSSFAEEFSSSNGSNNNKKSYIEHQVSKFDTLAGLAIKYGVEVVDIKRLNGLVTDLQMFALKKLLIPFPATHPPSASPSRGNGAEETLPRSPHLNLLESFESLRLRSPEKKVSSAMSSLQKFYGLNSRNGKVTSDGTEMAVYRSGSSDALSEGLLAKASPIYGSSYQIQQSGSSSDGYLNEIGIQADYVPLPETEDCEDSKLGEKFVRRRQKAEVDAIASTPEKLLRGENGHGSKGFSPVTGKSLAMRPKSASRTSLGHESEPGQINALPVGLGDSLIADELLLVRKSSSTPSLQDQDNSSSSSIWPAAKWNLKPDLQSLTAAAITMPIFDGLSKPIAGRWTKTALD